MSVYVFSDHTIGGTVYGAGKAHTLRGDTEAALVASGKAMYVRQPATPVALLTNAVGAITGLLDGSNGVELCNVFDVRAFGAKGDGVTDDTAAIQAAIDAAGNRTFSAFPHSDGSASEVHHSKRAVIFQPGAYRTTAALVVSEGITMRAPGGHSSAVINYEGTGNAIVVNTTWTGAYDNPAALQNVRFFRWEGLALNAPNASVGVLIGSATLRYVEFLSGQITNVQGHGIYCGEAVYFVRLGNFEVNNCNVGVYVQDYCDLFTVDDRCAFFSNKIAALVIECPTFHVENSDFEGNRGPVAQIIVNATLNSATGLRGGMFINNRFGPERTVTTGSGTYTPSPYDIAFTESGGGSIPAQSRTKVIGNNFFSRQTGHADQKTAPILLNAKAAGLHFSANGFTAADYISGFFVHSTDAVLCGATGAVFTNEVDDVELVNPTIRGLFKGRAKPGYRRAVQASPTVAQFSTMYRSGISGLAALAGEDTFAAIALADSSARTNYREAIGIATYATIIDQQSKPIWIAGPGAIITTTVDFTGAAVGSPVYKSGNGFSLTSPAYGTALIVGRTATATTNGKMLVTLENAGIKAGNATYDPASLADGEGVTTTVSVTGAALGEMPEAAFSLNLQGVALTAWVSAAGTVSVRFQNETGAPVDLASGTLTARILPG